MCPYPTVSDLKSRMLRFPNCFKFVNGPSSIQQRRGEAQGNQWLWNSSSQESDSCHGLASEATWCSCSIYSRAWTRLELTSCNQDAENLPEIRPCNSDCFQYALCLPFYGGFLGSLQNAVRNYYSIDGDDCQDYCDGCCSPRATVVRNEQEIILRQRARRPRDGQAPDGEAEKQYLCYDPMAYPNKSAQPASATREDTLTQEQNKVHPCVDNMAGTDATAKTSPAKVHSLDAHAQQTKGSRRAIHGLEDDLATPGRAKAQEHILHNDPASAALIKPVPHDLGAMASRPGPSKNEHGPAPSSQ
ncbi:hypothetical protein V8C37DRAFT_394306 [Trichoderma ceciliae]